ncbi:MAG: methylenetetrahydrofolate reductase [NAD(P)H] [Clostridiales bacterium]|jgi:methylenetetrahydrofolate reductase (NADPH)|nr:methylenetetrahydrofolate reductase [NAD(P)H] [Clostridiales bacterium]
MKITDILKREKQTVSLEIFPPKQFSQLADTKRVVAETASLNPVFISCTYGATGGTSEFTVQVAKEIENHSIPALAHLTCVSSTKEKVNEVIAELKEQDIENILALRGDIPTDPDFVLPNDYKYASELITDIKKQGNFCIGGACYPEGHPGSSSLDEDMASLKIKVDAGAEFLTTQMFFDNAVYYDFRERAAKAGINIPILAGIMPVINASRIGKMIQLSKSRVPSSLAAIISKYGETPDMEKAGIEFAVNQINDIISNGFGNIHIYTMNRPNIAKAIISGIKGV